jgi:ABC-type uncharacterized transport system involved in gliding motility auxiliary subunit
MVQRILNIVGWLGTALVVGAVAIRVFQPEWDRYAMYMAWTGLVLVLLYPIAQWREIASHMSRRQSKYATVALTSTLVVLGILIAVNYLSNRRNARWDLTEGSINSLSEQSLRVLEDLEAPLSLVVVDRGANLDQHRDRMSMYGGASNRVSVQYVDVERDPLQAKQYGIEVVPTVVADYMGRRERVTTLEERELTSAIIRAVTGAERKLYFVQGHGERDPQAAGGDGYQGISTLLSGDNVMVETLLLSQTKNVPEDATVVAIVGPGTDFGEEEVAQLREYLTRGGKMLVALDPALGERPSQLPNLVGFLDEWGVEVGNDVVLDLSGRATSPSVVVAAPPYPTHPITDSFNVQTVFPLARSVTAAAEPAEGRTVQPIVQTVEDAWAETDIQGLQSAGAEPEMDEGSGDKAGPVSIGVAVTAPVAEPADQAAEDKDASDADPADDPDAEPPQTRLVVFGDADFGSNAVLFTFGNADLFLNSVSWLTAQESLIAIRPRERGASQFSITPTQIDAIWWASLVVVPALVAGVGILTWSRRRRS